MQLPMPAPFDPIDLTRPVLMGILNITPDSFSDGGQWVEPAAAVEQARQMIAQGADIIDVGGESTRPGSQRISPDEQINRVADVIEAIAKLGSNVVISIDTTRAAVAQAAIDHGASIINDVSAGQDDPAIMKLAAERGVPYVLMHMLGQPATMQNNPTYDDVVNDVEAFLVARVDAAIKAGVRREQIVIDPGIGFGKTREHNLELMANLSRFVATGYPVLLGTSRKRFMGSILARADGSAPAPEELVAATCATTCIGVAAGVQMFRVHDVQPNRDAADVAFAIAQSVHE